MDLQEKLLHFKEAALNSSAKQRDSEVETYKKGLEKIFAAHQEDANRKADLEIKHEADRIRLEGNQKLAKDQLHIKRKISRKNTELTDLLFKEVEEKLDNYMRTPAYDEFLIRHITASLEFAKSKQVTIYIDPRDAEKKEALESATGAKLTISEYPFHGGMRAVIPEKKILIDNSFETKLTEERQSFRFDGGEL